MEILGIGGWEILLILLLLLIVAGPKRMIAWSYTLGRYMAVIRTMWAETAAQLQKELKQSGVDVEIPKEIPTRGSLNSIITNTVTKIAAPVTDPLKETQKQLGVKDLMGPTVPRTLNKPVTEQTAPPASANGAAPTGSPATAASAANGAPTAPAAPSANPMGSWTAAPTAPATPDAAPPKQDEGGFGSWTGGN